MKQANNMQHLVTCVMDDHLNLIFSLAVEIAQMSQRPTIRRQGHNTVTPQPLVLSQALYH